MAILVFEHSATGGIARLGATLREHGHRIRTIRVHADDAMPVDLDDVHGIVVTGGNQHPWDELDWIRAEEDLLRQAQVAGLPIAGICLGSQILATALGGTAEKMDAGIELGWHDVSLTPIGREDPLHAGIAWNAKMFHWHRAHVTQLPPDARLLASSGSCKVQAWALGTNVYGFQHHPEVRPDMIQDWMDDDPGDLEEAGITREQLFEQTQQHWATFERLTDRLFEAISLLLMPVDRRYQGIAKAIHH